eukprot:TRINITY_DN31093_c0_g1_i1.p1 TRINITY_DN31093_c0_g1~~TRINITY_DN31093_c0_g1_i1.p1  ORF type:complete len:389 (-),score=35.77 TRINITY_DN31093_c0_g1_i1:97-1263(-)
MWNMHWLLLIFGSMASTASSSLHVKVTTVPSRGACRAESTGLPGSSLLQSSEVAAKSGRLVSAVSSKQLSEVEASALIHGVSMDRGMNDLVILFFVMALLMMIMVLGYIIVDASYKSLGGAAKEVPAAGTVGRRDLDPYSAAANANAAGARLSASQEPLPRASVTRNAQEAPRPSVHATGVQAFPPSRRPGITAPAGDLSGEAPDPRRLHLCGPELVVPDGQECNLEIPSIQHQSSVHDRIELPVNDSQQSCILRGVIFKAPLSDGTRILLQSIGRDRTWGSCRESSRPNCFTVHRSNNREVFGRIEMSAGGSIAFHPEGLPPHTVHFEGPMSGRIRILDGHGVLLAVSEIIPRGRAVRVGPLVDVGLVMLCQLSMDVLRLQDTGHLR